MRAVYIDDRKPEQFETHTWVVRALDRCMSGWGQAKGGYSFAAWACKPEHARKVQEWVESRSEMKFVTVCGPKSKPRFRNAAHVHIYVVDDNHPALAG